MALAGRLNFYTGNDFERTLELMQQSALARPKWETNSGYLRVQTIPKAYSENVYNKNSRALAAGFGEAPLPVGVANVPPPVAVVPPVPVPAPFVPRPLPTLAERQYGEAFPVEFLGAQLQQVVEAISKKVQCCIDIAAHSVMSAATLGVCPHYNVELPFGQIKPTSLFLITVGRSGDRKTAADSEAMSAVGDWERELAFRWKRDKPHYDAAMERWTKKQQKAFADPGVHPSQAETVVGPEPKKPVRPLVRCDDPTAEGLRDSFIQGTRVQGLYGDEGGKFLGGHSMREEHRLNCIGVLSTMWDGSEIRKVRAGDNYAIVRGYRLAAHLMMQPGIAENFLGNPLYQEQGILARFLVSWPNLGSLDGQRVYQGADPSYQEIIRGYKERVYQLLSTPLPEDARGELAT